MCPSVTVSPVTNVPAESRVCHYDELEERAKEAFPILAESADSSVDEAMADEFLGYDLVKYTDYYEITVS